MFTLNNFSSHLNEKWEVFSFAQERKMYFSINVFSNKLFTEELCCSLKCRDDHQKYSFIVNSDRVTRL